MRQQINPRRLRQQIYTMIDYIMALPAADTVQNVWEAAATLNQPMRSPAPALSELLG